MATNRALLIELRDRLLAGGDAVPTRAESFHRERAALLAQLEGALSWRGVLGRGQSTALLAPQVEAVAARGLALHDLFERLAQIEQQLAAATQTLGRVAAPALRDPDALPARLEHLAAEARRLGRQVKTDDDLMVDQRRGETLRTAGLRLGEALGLWLSAESALAGIRAPSRTAALEAALPDLGERLCRLGPTPEWKAELQALVDPLEQLARRPQPRAITETEKIIKALPRWARTLGEDGDAGAALSERFKARRKEWPGEDDRTFVELFEQARALEQGLLERAAAERRAALADLAARCALFADLVGADPGLDELVRDLGAETPDDPRDHEDWCAQLRDARAAFQNRVKRSESALVTSLGAGLAQCRQRLEALGPIPRLDARDGELARLRDTFDGLARAGQGADPLTLLDQVAGVRGLRAALDALEEAMGRDHAGLEEGRAALRRRSHQLAGLARGLAIVLPALPLEDPIAAAGPGSDPGGGAPSSPNPSSLEQARLELDRQGLLLTAAEAGFTRVCDEAITADTRRGERVLAVLTGERRAAAPPDPGPAPRTGDPGALAGHLAAVRSRLAAVEALLVAEEEALTAAAVRQQGALAAIPREPLGHHDRTERDALLRQFQQWRPDTPADPVDRLGALRELIESARHSEERIAAAARRLHARGVALEERVRRFNGLSLQGYCPPLYARVEALVHPPAQTRWPPGAQAGQLAEAERLLRLLERQAQRLAAREIGATLQVLERHARRTRDPQVQALVAEVLGLPPEQPPPVRLRRRLAEQLRVLGLDAP